MKIKIASALILFTVLITILISTTTHSQHSTDVAEKDFAKHFEGVTTNSFIKKESIEEKNLMKISANSLEILVGRVNKEFGIREDILRYIEKEIPPENEKAKKAAITYAQTSQFIYYEATNEEAIKAVTKKLISLECLRDALKGDEDPIAVPKYIAKLMRNTPERDKHMWDVDKRYFSSKLMSYGSFSDAKIKEMCAEGNY
jgi:hypothetical protein